MDENEQTSKSIKISLLGNDGVGKTSIINRYIKSDFNENTFITQGGDCFSKILNRNGKSLELEIWDTAGQEKFNSLVRNFYKDSFIIILVYDVGDRESFEDLKIRWYTDLQMYGKKYAILGVVGNKTDLYEKEEIPKEEAEKFAKEINAIFMLVSAKTGNDINQLFNKLIDKYLEKDFQVHVKESLEISKRNIKIEKEIKKNKKNCC